MRKLQFVVSTLVLLLTLPVLAQESEFQQKIQEDMDGYKDRIQSACGATVTMKWMGKLGFNPRESEKPEWNGVSTLVTSGLEAVANACRDNGPVKKAVGKVKKIEAKKGKGTIGYKLKGSTLTLTVDPAYKKNNPAGQRDDLSQKMVKDIDK
jgi:hypothetical protein